MANKRSYFRTRKGTKIADQFLPLKMEHENFS